MSSIWGVLQRVVVDENSIEISFETIMFKTLLKSLKYVVKLSEWSNSQKHRNQISIISVYQHFTCKR